MTFRKLQFQTISFLIRLGTSILCRIEKNELDKLPKEGPLIACTNHIGSLEVPLIHAHLQPRKVTAMAKAEAWESPFFAWLFDLWRMVPVRRGEADLDAIRKTIQRINEGYIFGITPEGTRNRDGKLKRGHPGIVPIALKTGAPLIPLAHWGVEYFSQNFKKLRRTDFHVRVGKPFVLDTGRKRVNGEMRQAMVDEIMIELAKLLPEEYRGYYANKVNKKLEYIRYID